MKQPWNVKLFFFFITPAEAWVRLCGVVFGVEVFATTQKSMEEKIDD